MVAPCLLKSHPASQPVRQARAREREREKNPFANLLLAHPLAFDSIGRRKLFLGRCDFGSLLAAATHLQHFPEKHTHISTGVPQILCLAQIYHTNIARTSEMDIRKYKVSQIGKSEKAIDFLSLLPFAWCLFAGHTNEWSRLQ